MSSIDDSGPAHPVQDCSKWQAHGMNLRQYAAIELRVPNSGLPWLDDMIRESQRDALAGQALAGMCADPEFGETSRSMAQIAYAHADAMLEARKVQR